MKREEEKEVKQKRIHRLMLEASGNRSKPIVCLIGTQDKRSSMVYNGNSW